MTNPPLPTVGATDDFATILAENDRSYRERHRDWFDRLAKWSGTSSRVATDTQTIQMIREGIATGDWAHAWRPAQISVPRYDDDMIRYVNDAAREVLTPAPQPAGAELYSARVRGYAYPPRTSSRPPQRARNAPGLPLLTIPLVLLGLGIPLAETHMTPSGQALTNEYFASLSFVVGIFALLRRHSR